MFATNAESVNVWKEVEKGVYVYDHTESIRKEEKMTKLKKQLLLTSTLFSVLGIMFIIEIVIVTIDALKGLYG